jgi:hypothetical protein
MIQHESKSTSAGRNRSAGSEAKQGVKKAARQAKQQASSAVEQQKSVAAERIGALGQAIRQTAQNLDANDPAGIGCYAHQAADRIEQFSEYIRERELRDLMSGAQSWARRNPALFLGGCFAAGLLIARFLKSSQENKSEGSDGRHFGGSRFSAEPYGSDQEQSGSGPSPASQYGRGFESPTTQPGFTEPASGISGSTSPGTSWEEP